MQKFKTSDGLTLAYESEGEGPVLLCLAGLTRSSKDFTEMRAALHGAGVRVITLDSRGRGESDWDPNPMNYSVPIEARDALELLDHLGLDKAAVIGTSRGGLLAMIIAATAKHRLSGVLLNDVGPEIDRNALGLIADTVGRNPVYKTYEVAATSYPRDYPGFDNVPQARWETEVRRLWKESPEGLAIRYDPALQLSVRAAFEAPAVDLWPLFDALEGLPLALLRGANSALLTVEAAAEMRRRRPDMLFAEVPDRAHIPFLDEAESLEVIHEFIGKLR